MSVPVRLFLLGFLSLFVELVLIRYLAGNIWNLGYFPNLVLLAAFVGLGAGFVLHGRWSESATERIFAAAPVVICVLVALVTLLHPSVPGFSYQQGEVRGQLYFSGAPSEDSVLNQLYFAACFLLIIAIFAAIGQRLADLFARLRPLHAYTLDIAGSCCGIVTFMAMSALQASAWIWFVVVLVLFLLTLQRWRPVAALVLIGAIAMVIWQDTRLLQFPEQRILMQVTWSPYQKLELTSGPPFMRIWSNGLAHQQMEPPELMKPGPTGEVTFYAVPYLEAKKQGRAYKNVLILGAGSGNDVLAALIYGAEHVDAVEIDPVIQRLGAENHPGRPYQDPRVTVTIDDGRAFMTRATRKYDLIVFALTDSLVKASPQAELRLENYLYTADSVKRAASLLAPGGDMLFYNFYRREWIVTKIEQMVHAATGWFPKLLYVKDDFWMLVAGSSNHSDRPLTAQLVDVPTDDWPFFYVRTRKMPENYFLPLCFVGLMLLGLLGLVQRKEPGRLPLKLAFALMGAAFLLLETKSVIQFSLLFGTTWINNSLVFLGVLLLVLAANWTATVLKIDRLWPIFALLIAACTLPFLFPLSGLLEVQSLALRFVLGSLLVFTPVFFANLLFAVAFRDQPAAEHLFGWNLVGATVGGLMEYASVLVGYSALSVVVAVLYTVCFICLLASRKGAAATVPAAA